MAWLKGVRTDGFIKIDENVNFRGTILGAGDGMIRPHGALDYYVDGTDGNDTAHSGKSWEGAFKTIQVAITAQIANNSGKGDIIWVAPGSYAESLTGTLSKVQIIGTNCGGTTHAVSIRPTESYSYTGSMTDSAFRNIMFMSPSTNNKTYPAVLLTYMGYSVIDSCTFIGRDTTCVEGLQFGATADGTTVIKCDFSQITNNQFTSFYGASSEFSHGIKIGTTTGTNGAYRQMWHSLIANNVIHARTIGIWLGCGPATAAGTVIRNNWIGSDDSGHGCTSYGIGGLATGAAAMHGLIVADNYIMAADGLYQIGVGNSFNNFISASSASVVCELPVRT